MTPNFLALTEETTAAAATERIRELADIEMVFYVYVIDDENQLKGVISLRQLVATKPDTPLKDLMTTRVFFGSSKHAARGGRACCCSLQPSRSSNY